VQLLEELGASRSRSYGSSAYRDQEQDDEYAAEHYNYEDEDQSTPTRYAAPRQKAKNSYSGPKYNSIDNIAEFFASRGKKFTRPQVPVEESKSRRSFKPGQRVRHPKYGEGTVYQREGEGEDAKVTVQFPRFGLKKLVEKYAQLEKA
jgi:DNA helicase-2/ATP-dependent DNA helicase PcrA